MEEEIKHHKTEEKKIEESPLEKPSGKTENKDIDETKEKKVEKKKETPKIKKDEAKVYGNDLSVSMKVAREICRFIKGKKIDAMVDYLELVKVKKKPMPMRGEYGHKKGIGVAGGKYPVNASEDFIRLLKNLKANANVNGLEDPVIFSAMANIASRPFGKFGRIRKKRCHVLLVAREKKPSQNKNQKKENKESKK